MSELSKQALKVDNNQSFPNNNAGLITPSALRTFNENMIDSTVNQATYTADSASFNSRINNVTGSATNTGSLLTTASFDNNTRNLTFTKGDSSTFAVNIPDASGSILPSGVVSGSSQINYPFISNIPSGIVSGSSQVSYTGLSNIPAGIVSGSSQIILQDTTGLLSGSRIDGAVTSSLTSSLSNQALDVVVNVRNNTGAQINKGTIVRIIGATGDQPLIQTASWDNDSTSANTLGWVLADIPNGDFGKVVTQGILTGVNTDPTLGYAAGQVLYLSSSGQYTNVIPPAPYHEVRLGQVLRAQQNNGSVFVLIQNGYELGELHDVNINTSSLANNQVLAYNSASGQWVNQSLNGLGFATTGSNTFIGNQTITGSLLVSSSVSCSIIVPNVFAQNGLVVDGNLRVTNGTVNVDQAINTAGIYTDTLGRNSNDPINVDNGLNIRPNAPGVSATNVSISGSLILSQSIQVGGDLTASLQEGYVWVGNSSGKTTTVPTSSFGGGGTGNGFPFSGSAVITGSLSVSETVKSQVYINPQTISGFTIPTGNNAMLVGPVAVSGSIVLEGNSKLIVLDQITGSTLPSGLLSSSVTDFTTYSASVDSRLNNISVDTSSLATTGSNTFIGNQTITGSLFLSSSDAIEIIVPNFPGQPAPGGVSITGSMAVNGNFAVNGGGFTIGQANMNKIVGTNGGVLDIVSNVKIFNDSDINQARTLGVSGSVFVSQSIHVGETVRLSPSNPLPSGTTGSLAVSGSSLYFFDGSWRQVSLI